VIRALFLGNLCNWPFRTTNALVATKQQPLSLKGDSAIQMIRMAGFFLLSHLFFLFDSSQPTAKTLRMTLLSPEFAFALLIFLLLYWACARSITGQNYLLLCAAYAFAGQADWRIPIIMLAFAALVWTLGKYLLHQKHDSHKKIAFLPLFISIIFTILPLLLFKYYDFAREVSLALLQHLSLPLAIPALPLLLPIGISFYTLTAVTYLLSVHRKELKPASLPDVMLLLAFFPVLTAGPICRANSLLPQIQARRVAGDVNWILVLLVLALLKKWCLATYLGDSWVDPIFSDPESYHPLELLGGLYAYTLQIYFDFSGYSDLAMAIALMLGFQVPRNFSSPYIAKNIKEFWHRWHISLSTWIRDYIYIPLGGSRNGWWHTQFYLLIAMVLSGLWHGAAEHYFWWGALHALGLSLCNIWQGISQRLGFNPFRRLPALAQLITLHYIVLTWVWFRADSSASAWQYLHAMFDFSPAHRLQLPIFGLFLCIFFFWFSSQWWVTLPDRIYSHLANRPDFYKVLWLSAVLILITLCSPSGIPNFIYAQF
jgi:D-alanyl-lipoteichoic acid acyltransferase DltB (MBOAT superfamily)